MKRLLPIILFTIFAINFDAYASGSGGAYNKDAPESPWDDKVSKPVNLYQTFDKSKQGENFMPGCIASLSDGLKPDANENPSSYSATECAEREKIFSSAIGGKFMTGFSPQGGENGQQLAGGIGAGVTPEPVKFKMTPAQGVDSPGAVYEKFMKSPTSQVSTYLSNWGNADSILMPKLENNATPDQKYDDQTLQIDPNTGEKVSYFSPVYRSQKEVIMAGACQMIETPSGRFKAKKLEEPKKYCRTCDENGECEQRDCEEGEEPLFIQEWEVDPNGSGDEWKTVDVEVILDHTHPFAPRHSSEWQERTSITTADTSADQNLPNASGNVKSKYSLTNICGRDKQEYLNNIRSWEDFGGISDSKVDSSVMQNNQYDEDEWDSFGDYMSAVNQGSSTTQTNTSAGFSSNYGSSNSTITATTTSGQKSQLNSIGSNAVSNYNNGGSSSSNSDVNGMNPMSADYNYYNYTQNSSSSDFKDGLILVNTSRYISYLITNEVIYQVCYAVCTAVTFGMGSSECQQLCSDIAQYSSCRMHVLPPVQMKNRLKLTYGYEGLEPIQDLSYLYKDHRASWTAEDKGLPNYAKGSGTNGYGWYDSMEEAQFKYNGPWVRDWVTGDAAPFHIMKGNRETPEDDPEDTVPTKEWEPWRYALAGVNKYYAVDESNPMEEGVYDMTSKIGGWEELKAYQYACMKHFGLQCICDFEKNFGPKGSDTGYVLARSSGYVLPTNYQKTSMMSEDDPTKPRALEIPAEEQEKFRSTKTSKVLQKIYVSKDKSDVIEIPRFFPASVNGKIFKYPQIGMKMADGSPWPGQDAPQDVGLDNADKGDVIIFYGPTDSFQSEVAGEDPYRKPFAAKVEVDKGNCLEISEANSSSMVVAGGIAPDTWAMPRKRKICKSESDVQANYAEEGESSFKYCHNTAVKTCIEKDWDKIIVWHINKDTRDFNPITGEKM